MKWIVCVIVLLIGIAIAAECLFTDVIPPQSLTRMRMTVIEARIRDYAACNHKLPLRLSDLPAPPSNRDGHTDDAWGRPFIYRPQTDGSVILGSHGKDGNNNGFQVRFAVSGVDPGSPNAATTEKN